MKKLWIGIIAAAAMAVASQAADLVNWGAPGGDTGIVTATTPMTKITTYTSTYINPADGVGGYDVNAAGQTRNFCGASGVATVFQITDNADQDMMEMVKNFKGAGGTVEAMIAWKATDFLTSEREIESFTVGIAARGTSCTVSYLIETADGWYKSDQSNQATGYLVFDETTVAAADLTWSSFNLFGVTGGTGPADTTNVLSVGAYITGTLPSGNWAGSFVRYVNVTAVSVPVPSTIGLL